MEHKKLDLSMLGSNDYTHTFQEPKFPSDSIDPRLASNKKSPSTLHSPPCEEISLVFIVYSCVSWENGGMAEKLQYGNTRFTAFYEVCSLDVTLLS